MKLLIGFDSNLSPEWLSAYFDTSGQKKVNSIGYNLRIFSLDYS